MIKRTDHELEQAKENELYIQRMNYVFPFWCIKEILINTN